MASLVVLHATTADARSCAVSLRYRLPGVSLQRHPHQAGIVSTATCCWHMRSHDNGRDNFDMKIDLQDLQDGACLTPPW